MKAALILTTVFVALTTASPNFLTTTKATATTTTTTVSVAVGIDVSEPSNFPPICTFNPQKGEYECPETKSADGIEPILTFEKLKAALDDIDDANEAPVASKWARRGHQIQKAPVQGGDIVKASGAADCNKCQSDWHECMKKWGCWFYDCNGPCKCQVAKNDPSCKDCPAGQCHA